MPTEILVSKDKIIDIQSKANILEQAKIVLVSACGKSCSPSGLDSIYRSEKVSNYRDRKVTTIL